MARVSRQHVESAFTRAGSAARAAGLNTDGWTLGIGSASLGSSYTLDTGRGGSSTIPGLPSTNHIGKTAAEAEKFLDALRSAWEAVAKARTSSGFVVAYFVPHNEGIESGIVDRDGFDSGLSLVDLYEVDATIRSWPDRASAEAWLAGKYEDQRS